MEIKDNAFNAERERKESFNDSDPLRKPRSSSFKDSEKFVYRAGAFVREDSDAYSSGQCLSNHIRLYIFEFLRTLRILVQPLDCKSQMVLLSFN